MQKFFRLFVVFMSLILLTPSISGVDVDKTTSTQIDKIILSQKDKIINIRRLIHMNPELKNLEFETSRLIASRLLSMGLDVETRVANTGVIGILHGDFPGPTIGIQADMDALPIQELADVPFRSLNHGRMHAGGHDIQIAIVLGTAYVLNSLRSKIRGSVKFIFQPAGELIFPELTGARLMIEEGVLEKPEVKALFGFHLSPESLGTIKFSSGAILSSLDKFSITIKGKIPNSYSTQKGIDSITLASHIIVNIQSMMGSFLETENQFMLSIDKIEGGVNSDLPENSVRFHGTIKALNEKNRSNIRQYIRKLVSGMTATYNAEYEMKYQKGIPSIYNHPELANIMMPTLKNILGEKNIYSVKPGLITDDFSYYCQKIPGFYFFLGANNPRYRTSTPLNSPYFTPDEQSIPLGIKIMCHLLIDCLNHQSFYNSDIE